MSLNADKLAAMITDGIEKTKITPPPIVGIKSDGTPITASTDAFQLDLKGLATIIAEAVVEHIKNNLDVEVPEGKLVQEVAGQATGKLNTAVKCEVQ